MSPLLLCTLTQVCAPADRPATPTLTLALTAAQRQRSRLRVTTPQGDVLLHLPRSTVLMPGDWLQNEEGSSFVEIAAELEPVYWVTARSDLELLRGVYHLGNRHVPLELTIEGLRLEPDPVLKEMLEGLGLQVVEEKSAFQPESGAYQTSGPKHHDPKHHDPKHRDPKHRDPKHHDPKYRDPKRHSHQHR